MISFTEKLFALTGRKASKIRNSLQTRVATSLISIFITCAVMFTVTGALYIRSDGAESDRETENTAVIETGETFPDYDYYSSPSFLESFYDLSRFPDTVDFSVVNLSAVSSPETETEYTDFLTDVGYVAYVERTIEEAIPYEIIEEGSNLLAIGTTRLETAGAEGVRHIIVRETIENGEIIASEIIDTIEISPPTAEKYLVGKALAEPYSKRDFPEIELVNGLPVNYEYKLSGTSAAYTAGESSGTASGRPLVIGTAAVDPDEIPYGSLLYIVTKDGIVYGAAIAADTGGFIYSTDVVVDVYKGLTSENYDAAINWGLRDVDVYVISTGNY